MLVSILASYYFEHYIEQENLQCNSLKLIVRSLLSEEKQIDRENAGIFRRFYYKIRKELRNWAYDIVHTYHETYKPRVKLPDSNQLQRNIMLGTPQYVVSQFARQFEANNKRRLSILFHEDKRTMHFWVAALDEYVGDQNSFQRLQNDINLFDDEQRIHSNNRSVSFSESDSEIYDDDIIIFCMNEKPKQVEAWKKADIDTKLKYWNILQENINVLDAKYTPKRRTSISEYDHDFEVEDSYDMEAIEKYNS